MKNEIWKWFGSEYKVHFENEDDYRQVLKWSGCRPGGVYYMPDGTREYDAIIPAAHYDRVAKLLGLPPKTHRRRKNTKITPIGTQQVTRVANEN